MKKRADSIAESYIRLALAIGQHKPGYVDAYYGPIAWQEEAKQAGQSPLTQLNYQVDNLAETLKTKKKMATERYTHLEAEIRAMQTVIRLLQGEPIPLTTQTKLIYDITPTWTNETIFEEAHRTLDSLLPPGNSLVERLEQKKIAHQINFEANKTLIEIIARELRQRTQTKYALPPKETFDLKFVKDKPWGAYNWYKGNFHSEIEINLDNPSTIWRVVDLMAHEGYPGHHTELAKKETRLVHQKGWWEHSIMVMNSPSCVVAEGIATSALFALMSKDELITWYQEDLSKQTNLPEVEVEVELAILQARKFLGGVIDNAALLFLDQGESEANILAYLQAYSLMTEEISQRMFRFIKQYGPYTFTYHYGNKIVEQALASHPDPTACFNRLLTEAITPSQIRAMISK